MHALARRTQRLLPGQAVARLEPLRAQRVEHGVGDGGFVFDEEDGGHGAGSWDSGCHFERSEKSRSGGGISHCIRNDSERQTLKIALETRSHATHVSSPTTPPPRYASTDPGSQPPLPSTPPTPPTP